jgi:hypothetical protein
MDMSIDLKKYQLVNLEHLKTENSSNEMVMVTKVYKLNVKLMVEMFEQNPNVWTLDEACVSSVIDNTYILWECKWLLKNSSN